MPEPDEIVWHKLGARQPYPRCTIPFKNFRVEVWCIEDLISSPALTSNTAAKAKALDQISKFGSPPSAVLALGTAAYPSDLSQNGCVSVGGLIYINLPDPSLRDPDSVWVAPPDMMQTILRSPLATTFLPTLAVENELLQAMGVCFLTPPQNPATGCRPLVVPQGVAISSVDVVSAAAYKTVDPAALAAAQRDGAKDVVSVETIHGVIRASFPDAPFLFVSGISNRLGSFSSEALGNYAQNFVAAHNAGIVLARMLPHLNDFTSRELGLCL